MNPEIKQNLKSSGSWLRGLNMLIFAVFFWVSGIILATVVIFQFLTTLFTGKQNPLLLEFAENLSTYFYQIVRFLTYTTESKPFPFQHWPGGSKTEGKNDGSETSSGTAGDVVENH